MEFVNLFPTPVCKIKINREFITEENKFVSSQEVHANMGNTTSNNSYVLNDESMSSIRTFIDEQVNKYFQEVYAPKNEVKLRVTQSWFNYSKPGQWHHKHAHPGSFISGVLYMKAAKESDRIYFYNEDYRQFPLPTEKYNPFNSVSWWLPVETGDLMLFPSSLTHSVEPVQGDQERISLAFNTFLVGYVGDEASLTGLHL